MQKSIAVLGTGSWGTALAVHLARNGHHVTLWGRRKENIETMKKQRVNLRFLPNVVLPELLALSSDLELTLKDADAILIAVPSHGFVELITAIKPHFNAKQKLIWATKGLDPFSGHFLHDVAYSVLGKDIKIAILSGPSFAKEIAQGLPAAVAIAASDSDTAKYFQDIFHNDKFRTYITDDLIGVAICGSTKNVLAIATGIADGLGLGANARAALMTRGFAEILRLSDKLGAKRDTLMGLAGLGDMILTCTDSQSRNYRFGMALGQGLSIADSLQKIDQVVEGINTSFLITKLAQQYHIEMPITEKVVEILHHEKSPAAAMNELLSRKPNSELR